MRVSYVSGRIFNPYELVVALLHMNVIRLDYLNLCLLCNRRQLILMLIGEMTFFFVFALLDIIKAVEIFFFLLFDTLVCFCMMTHRDLIRSS